MNILAHLTLAWPDEGLVVGNFLADQVKGGRFGSLPPGIQEGVRMHRAIDDFTDRHPATRASTARLRTHIGRYAPVAIDVLYDHFLAREWARYGIANTSLGTFVDGLHNTLSTHRSAFSPGTETLFQAMREHRWLESYARWEGFERAMQGMERRTRYPSQLGQSALYILPELELYHTDFKELWQAMEQRFKKS